LSLASDFSVAPIFEDSTVYSLDAHLLNAPPGFLPTPRSSLQTQWTTAYHLHVPGMPDAGGFFQIRNARGDISLPSTNTIVNRNTTDYSFNFAVNPVFQLGSNAITLSAGLQRTIRRDSQDPLDMNQNLFRQFVYLSTSSIYNWVSVQGYAVHEAGPFTESHLRSRDVSGALEFRVGRPWGKTALVTGWGGRDEQYFPVIREYYYTSTYAGIERRFGENLRLRAVGEYLRSWRVEGQRFAIAQAFRPAASIEYSFKKNWTIEASSAYSRNMGRTTTTQYTAALTSLTRCPSAALWRSKVGHCPCVIRSAFLREWNKRASTTLTAGRINSFGRLSASICSKARVHRL
jgi:hypothetical protein